MTRFRRTFARAAAATAACLCLLALCGATALARDAAPAKAKAKVEIIHDFVFSPGRTLVARGGRVTFYNPTRYTHTATNGRGAFDTGHIPPGESETVRFKQPGVYAFHCELHPFMTGKIVVR